MARYPHSDKAALSPADVLDNPSTSFGGLLKRANLLLQIEQALRGMLDTDLAGRYRVANVRHGRLILLAPAAAWATRLRMLAPQLLDRLHQSGYADIESIDVRVGPLVPEPPPATGAKPLSSAAKQALDLMSRLGKESED